jgi:hypothetical protein
MPYNYTTLNTYCGGNSSADCTKSAYSHVDSSNPAYSHIDYSIYEGFSPGFSSVGVL